MAKVKYFFYHLSFFVVFVFAFGNDTNVPILFFSFSDEFRTEFNEGKWGGGALTGFLFFLTVFF